jgi:hypothetical protein
MPSCLVKENNVSLSVKAVKRKIIHNVATSQKCISVHVPVNLELYHTPLYTDAFIQFADYPCMI